MMSHDSSCISNSYAIMLFVLKLCDIFINYPMKCVNKTCLKSCSISIWFSSFAVLCSIAVVVICGTAANRFTGNKLMKWRFIFLFYAAGLVNTFYLFVMPQLITSQSQNALGGMGLTIVRLFVHPAIWSVMLFFFRVVTRHLGKKENP